MTKAKAYDLLHDKIKKLCIEDIIYGTKPEELDEMNTVMVAVLSDIVATDDLLNQILRENGNA